MSYKKKFRNRKKFCFGKLIFVIAMLFVVFIFLLLNKKIFDEILIQLEPTINNKINLAIDSAVSDFVKKNRLTTSDFYNINFDGGQINFFSVNNILINKFCCKLAVYIPDKFLKDSKSNEINFCLGTFITSSLGINFLNLTWPNIKIKILPIGSTLIDYETKLINAGINQTNFQVWLKIKFNSQIINPLNRKKFVFTKKIFLVNTLINGRVPDAYINGKNFLK